METRCRPHLKGTTDSWRVDETYVKVKKVWMYLDRAVDSQGNTLEFLLSPTREAQAAQRFFAQALGACHTVIPRVITVDKNAAYPRACKELQAEGSMPAGCELRHRKYLNNLIEQNHRFIKRLVKPGMVCWLLRISVPKRGNGQSYGNLLSASSHATGQDKLSESIYWPWGLIKS
jgi:IS6 family transposase